MAAWTEVIIPQEDNGWRHIALSSKNLTGANVRFSPLIDTNNIAGLILHNSVNSSVAGLANEVYKHTDKTANPYTWYPLHILNNRQFDENIQVWFAEEAYVLNWGGYVNPLPAPVDESEFFDVDFLGSPTIHIPTAHMASVVEVLHAVASYLNAKL